MDVWDIWVIAALLLFIIEVFTSGYIVTCLAFGAVGGAVAAVCDLPDDQDESGHDQEIDRHDP